MLQITFIVQPLKKKLDFGSSGTRRQSRDRVSGCCPQARWPRTCPTPARPGIPLKERIDSEGKSVPCTGIQRYQASLKDPPKTAAPVPGIAGIPDTEPYWPSPGSTQKGNLMRLWTEVVTPLPGAVARLRKILTLLPGAVALLQGMTEPLPGAAAISLEPESRFANFRAGFFRL